jgi:imidazolonepropionase-like amidohydrolase
VTPPRWLDLRLVLGVVLVLGSVILGAKVVSDAGHTDRVLSVSRDLAAGTVLTADDVAAVSVRLPAHGRGLYLAAGTVVSGKVLNEPVSRGQLLPSAALGVAAPTTTVTVPFAADAAPKLRGGQRIEVWLSTPACPSSVLIGDVTVQTVESSGGGAFSSGDGQAVVIAVPSALAQRIVTALAFESPVIRAGVLTGPAQGGVNYALPDIDGCGARAGSS